MDGMSAMKDSMKILTPMMQGKTPYNAQTVQSEAEIIGRHAGESMTKLFPEGSDGKPSEAKPEIWQDWGSFAELASQLETYSEGLVLAADNGLMMSGSGQGSGMMGGASMMGGGSMMGGSPDQTQLSEMPADGVFMMLSQTCSACHTQFRSE
jgi:cytochrome c556